MNMFDQMPRQQIPPPPNQRFIPPPQPLPLRQPAVNIRNIIGVIGIIALLYAGQHLYRCATEYNPFEWFRQVFGGGDVARLIVLGVVLILCTVALKRLIRQ